MVYQSKNHKTLWLLIRGTGQNNYSRTGPTFGVGGGSQRHHLSSNITKNILLALIFELTQEYSASKSQHY